MMTREQFLALAPQVAADMNAAAQKNEPIAEPLRRRFIDVRTALLEQGIFDPVLVRFDSATAPKASTVEIAEELEQVVTEFSRSL